MHDARTVIPHDRVRMLVRRAQEGDREAFGELYRLHHGSVFRLARFYLPQAEAEDATAETFLRAWTSLPRYRYTGAPFASWLYGIARHVVSDMRKAARRVEPREELPERAWSDRRTDDRLELERTMSRLPDEQRRVIEMKYLMGMTNDEVAAALGKSAGAVNTQQWRALAALRGLLGEDA